MLSLPSFCSCWWWDVPDLADLPYGVDFAWWKRKKKAESLKRLEYNKHCFFLYFWIIWNYLCMWKKKQHKPNLILPRSTAKRGILAWYIAPLSSFVLPLPFSLCKASPIQQPGQAGLISRRSKNTVVKISWNVSLQDSRWQKGQRWRGDGEELQCSCGHKSGWAAKSLNFIPWPWGSEMAIASSTSHKTLCS